jgi:hypothetical protein
MEHREQMVPKGNRVLLEHRDSKVLLVPRVPKDNKAL